MSNFRRRLIQTSEESMYAKFTIVYPGYIDGSNTEFQGSIGFCVSFGILPQTGTAIVYCSTCMNEYVKLKVKITNKETKEVFREYNHIFKKGDYIGFRLRIDGDSNLTAGSHDNIQLNSSSNGMYIIAYDIMEEGLYDVEIFVSSNSPIIINYLSKKALEIIDFKHSSSSKGNSDMTFCCLHSVEKLIPDASKTTNGRGFSMKMTYKP